VEPTNTTVKATKLGRFVSSSSSRGIFLAGVDQDGEVRRHEHEKPK
jgi:hypothetical protein